MSIGSYDEEEFEQVRAENQRPTSRKPRWEAEPNYGCAARPPAAAPGRGRRRRSPRPPAAARRRPRRGTGERRPVRRTQALGAGLEGLPIVKPPYGVIAAIDLNTGKLIFQVPHGDTPDNVRNHPLLQGMNIPKTGQGAASASWSPRRWSLPATRRSRRRRDARAARCCAPTTSRPAHRSARC